MNIAPQSGTSTFDATADHYASAFGTESMQVGLAEQQDFRPSPLEPTWILDGNPEARSLPLAASADGMFTCGRWSCTEGRFRFHYACDEIVEILEGSVTIEESGKVRTLRAGDVAYFPQGLETIWTVHGYVKKFAIFRSKPRRLIDRVVRRAMRTLRTLTALLSTSECNS